MRGLGLRPDIRLSPVRDGGVVAPVDPYSTYAFAYDYKSGEYWSGGTQYAETAIPGRTYSRTGAKMEQDASGVPTAFAANVPAILPGVGYYSRLAATNLLLNAGQALDLATQSVTLPASAHTLSFIGTGTVTLSGASTAGPLVGTGANNRVSLTFTPTAGSVTFTVTGSVTYAGLVAGTSAGPIIATAGASATVGGDTIQYAPPTIVDQDMLIWTTVRVFSSATTYSLILDDGTTTGNVIELRASTIAAYAIRVYVATALVYNQTVPILTPGQEVTTLLRRASGAWQAGQLIGGTITWAASTAGAVPTGFTRMFIGKDRALANINGPQQGAFIKPGTFANDAAVLAAVAESA